MDTSTSPILVVEDNPDDLELTLQALSPTISPHLIDVARDGAEALEYLFRTDRYATRPPDHPTLILLDQRMPFLDGLEVLKKIKADHQLQTIPVVMLTASDQDNNILAGFNLGITDYIVKGANFDRFAENVRTVAATAIRQASTPAQPE